MYRFFLARPVHFPTRNASKLKNRTKPLSMIYRFLLSLLFITTAAVVAQAQTYPYYGCVTDSAGEALIGANISVKNTRLGTVTDLGEITASVTRRLIPM